MLEWIDQILESSLFMSVVIQLFSNLFFIRAELKPFSFLFFQNYAFPISNGRVSFLCNFSLDPLFSWASRKAGTGKSWYLEWFVLKGGGFFSHRFIKRKLAFWLMDISSSRTPWTLCNLSSSTSTTKSFSAKESNKKISRNLSNCLENLTFFSFDQINK